MSKPRTPNAARPTRLETRDKTELSTHLRTLLGTLSAHPDADLPYDPRDEDIHNATESELFAILDEELGS